MNRPAVYSIEEEPTQTPHFLTYKTSDIAPTITAVKAEIEAEQAIDEKESERIGAENDKSIVYLARKFVEKEQTQNDKVLPIPKFEPGNFFVLWFDLDEKDHLIVTAVDLYRYIITDRIGGNGTVIHDTHRKKIRSWGARKIVDHYGNKLETPAELPYIIPDYANILGKKSKLAQQYRNLFARHVTGEVAIDLFTFTPVNVLAGLPILSAELFLVWTALHDPIHLEQVYGLPAIPMRETPRILYSLKEIVRYILEPPELGGNRFVGVLNLNPEESLREAIVIAKEGENGYTIGYHNKFVSRKISTAELAVYSLNRAKGGETNPIFVSDRIYNSHQNAAAARDRLLRALVAAPVTSIGISGAVSGRLAESVPRQIGFNTKYKPPARYIPNDPMEARWREICGPNNEPTTAPIQELRQIASALDISIPQHATKSILCKLIAEQYEREFGERGRLREAGEEVIPLKTHSKRSK